VHEKVAAPGLLLAICLLVGLLIRTRPDRRIGHWLTQHIFDRIPGFALMRGMTRQLAGDKEEELFQPVLVGIEEALAPARHTIKMDFTYDGGGVGKGGSATISVDNHEVALPVPRQSQLRRAV
jgi:hypothetical protein